MSSINVEFESIARERTQKNIEGIVPRELLPNGAYAPIKGIYDIGWKAWTQLPEADFVKEMRKLDDGLLRDNKEWMLRLAPMVASGELTVEEIREWELAGFITVDLFSIRIAEHAFSNLENREVRDIILRHSSEELGHAELKADFLVHGFGLNRERDVWNAKPSRAAIARRTSKGAADLDELKKSNPILAYATVPFLERTLPMQNQLFGKGLRDHYGFNDDVLGFYDLHTYVDIYHERLGLYLMGKYATKSEDKKLFAKCVESSRLATIQASKTGYEALKTKV